ncbi:hypothetical protein [Ammoniphilus sp. 3BR4]|uniref:hypothetical protein n=1 Tax=Ammoniphilus sp. 3BR4 TaxID=3158265 RepID=UPI003466D694
MQQPAARWKESVPESSIVEGGNNGYLIYTRVSNQGQKDDLANQIEFLRTFTPTMELESI